LAEDEGGEDGEEGEDVDAEVGAEELLSKRDEERNAGGGDGGDKNDASDMREMKCAAKEEGCEHAGADEGGGGDVRGG